MPVMFWVVIVAALSGIAWYISKWIPFEKAESRKYFAFGSVPIMLFLGWFNLVLVTDIYPEIMDYYDRKKTLSGPVSLSGKPRIFQSKRKRENEARMVASFVMLLPLPSIGLFLYFRFIRQRDKSGHKK